MKKKSKKIKMKIKENLKEEKNLVILQRVQVVKALLLKKNININTIITIKNNIQKKYQNQDLVQNLNQ